MTGSRAADGGRDTPLGSDLLDAYDYDLPEDRIAQEPSPDPGDARLMVLGRRDGAIAHRRIRDLPGLLRAGDLLVVNDSRVRQARIFGRKASGGQVEVLLLSRIASGPETESWSGLVRASRAPRAGALLHLDGGLEAEVESEADSEVVLRLRTPDGAPVEDVLRHHGTLPLPPYIRRHRDDPRNAEDLRRYQTVYADEVGSAAAPTAGLHLSRALLDCLEDAGIRVAAVTLHVGRGTFQPIRAWRLEEHRMHEEWCRLSTGTAAAIRETRAAGARVVAVGTTVVRTLEARWGPEGPQPGEGPVNLFLRPGHRFRGMDALLTNFHLPRSTLLVLIAAFGGRKRMLMAYREAVAAGYRFYSYGDAMLVQ